MTKEYNTQVSEEIEGKVTEKLTQDFSRTESRILGALSKLDKFFLSSQWRTCSGTVPGTYQNNSSENREPTSDRSSNYPYPEEEYSVRLASISADSDREGKLSRSDRCWKRDSLLLPGDFVRQTKETALHK